VQCVQVVGAAEARFAGQNALESLTKFRIKDAVDDGIKCRIAVAQPR